MSQRELGEGLHRLREAFSGQEWDPAGGEHPDSETLWSSAAGELDPAREEEVALHLARCAACASSWRVARELLPTAGEVPAVRPPGREGRRAWWRRPGALAAAAALAAGVGLGAMVLHRGRRVPGPVYREQAPPLHLTASPETRTLSRSACRLRWTGAPDGSRYDLTVTGDGLETIAVVRALSEPEYTVPADRIPASAREILWRVTVHLPDGGILRSPTFRSRLTE